VLPHLVRRAVDAFRSSPDGRPVKLRVKADPNLLVETDPVLLEVVVRNLLVNAHKYSPPASPVAVVLRVAETEASVRVLDRGIGLGGGDHQRIFGASFRSEEARSRAPGSGIGLALCRRIVDGHGGHIWGAPRTGGGAEFGFWLPVSAAREEYAAG
jgi:two-component system sensor histidine kinase KdpD